MEVDERFFNYPEQLTIAINYHKKIVSGEIRPDRRRGYYFDCIKGRQLTKEEIIEYSKEYLRKAEIHLTEKAI